MKLISKKIIFGCEGRGDGNDPYLTRYTLFESKKLKVYFHIFHRSDFDDLHDHPWNFLSILLWRGYVEETMCPDCSDNWEKYHVKGYQIWKDKIGDGYSDLKYKECTTCSGTMRIKSRKWPLSFLYRSATHKHRVELLNGKRAMSLVFVGSYIRYWGFLSKGNWIRYDKYFTDNKC